MFSIFGSSSQTKSIEAKFRDKLHTLSSLTPELKEIFILLAEMSHHQESIKQEIGGNTAHNLFKKSFVFETIMGEIDQAISEYKDNVQCINMVNEEKKEHLSELKERNKKFVHMIVLIGKLIKITDDLLFSEKRDELNRHKNNHKENARFIIDTSSLATPLMIGYGVGYYTFTWLISAVSSVTLSSCVNSWMGLDDSRSGTVQLIDKYRNLLRTTQNNVEYVLTGKPDINNFYPLECPITKSKIKHPVLCTLDYQIYEKDEITKLLNQKGASPFNQQALREGQTVESVLLEFHTVQVAMEELEYRSQSPHR